MGTSVTPGRLDVKSAEISSKAKRIEAATATESLPGDPVLEDGGTSHPERKRARRQVR
jgi:hypothetical protein